MLDIIKEKKRLGEIAKQSAIFSWLNIKNGIYRNEEEKKYTAEYCENQIKYFKNLKL
jgi:hypothetical protein